MLKLNAKALMKEKNISKYRLHQLIDMSYQNLSKMLNNETKSIKYEMIETLCDIFECTPDDLFVKVPDEPEEE